MPGKLTKFISLCLCFLLIFEQAGFTQVLPSALNPTGLTPPLLRYLSVNQANPFNYFNFLLDKGLSPQGTVPYSPYIQAIDKGYTQGLESELPWEKDFFYQQYLSSYSKGEYKLEANLFGLRRMYWSGGMQLNLSTGAGPDGSSSPLVIILPQDVPKLLEDNPDLLEGSLRNTEILIEGKTDPSVPKDGGLPDFGSNIIVLPQAKKEIKDVSSPERLSDEPQSQPKAGASSGLQKDQSASLETEEGMSRRKFIKKSGIFAVTLAGLILLRKDILADIFPKYKLSLEEQRILRQDKGALDIVSPQDKDSLGTDNWRRYDSRKLLEAWSPPLRSKFLDYVKTKLIDSLDFIKDKIKPRYSEGEKNSEIGIGNLIKSGILDKHTAVILDSGGAHSVAMALRLMKRGYQPVVMFNNIPHSQAANRSEQDLAILLYFAEEAKALKDKGIITRDSPPVFILNIHRDVILLSGDFNNSYRYSSKDFPAAKDLKEHKITKIIYLNEANQDVQIGQDFQSFDRLADDIKPIVESWILGGIKVFYTGIAPWKEVKDKYIINQSTVPLRKDVDESLSLVVLSLVPEEELHFVSKTDEQFTAAPLEQAQSASSAVVETTEIASNVGLEEVKGPGGIDLSNIELTLKDEKFVSSLNPADQQILLAPLEILFFGLGSLVFLTGLAAKYCKDGWESLTLLYPVRDRLPEATDRRLRRLVSNGVYIHQIMLMLKDNLIKEIQNRELLFGILNQLKLKEFLDPQALDFLNLIQSQKPLSEIKFTMLNQ